MNAEPNQPAGYSGTPLVKKLGIKAGHRIAIVDPPNDYDRTLGRLQEGVIVGDVEGGRLDFIQLFCDNRAKLEAEFRRLKDALTSSGMLWVSWSKRSSGVQTDLSDGVVREIGLAHGLVDVKVAAVDETWSGLKFVYRLRDRAAR